MKLPKPGSLRRELTVVIILKIIFLVLLWYFFFSKPLVPADSEESFIPVERASHGHA